MNQLANKFRKDAQEILDKTNIQVDLKADFAGLVDQINRLTQLSYDVSVLRYLLALIMEMGVQDPVNLSMAKNLRLRWDAVLSNTSYTLIEQIKTTKLFLSLKLDKSKMEEFK